jgi:hypothetical protein
MRYRVTRCEANSVPDSQFAFTPGPGTLVYDRDNDTATQVPGGLDLIDLNADRIGRAAARQSCQRGGTASMALFGWAGCGCLSYLFLSRLAAVLRNPRRRPSGPTVAAQP